MVNMKCKLCTYTVGSGQPGIPRKLTEAEQLEDLEIHYGYDHPEEWDKLKEKGLNSVY